jgi:DNA-directed RNA polymerase subunit alpha
MTKAPELFFSCVDSRIQDQGSLYARFHVGPFVPGEAITFANALRRTLLSDIPGLVLTDLVIDRASHEFSNLPGIEETVLEIILNLKKLVFSLQTSKLEDISIKNNIFDFDFQSQGFLKCSGPQKVTAADIKLPRGVKCVNPNAYIATLTSGAELSLRFRLSLQSPQKAKLIQHQSGSENQPVKFSCNGIPMPVQKVNYVIKALNLTKGSEYIILEVSTDGSVLPQECVQYALKMLTHFFYKFASLTQTSL